MNIYIFWHHVNYNNNNTHIYDMHFIMPGQCFKLSAGLKTKWYILTKNDMKYLNGVVLGRRQIGECQFNGHVWRVVDNVKGIISAPRPVCDVSRGSVDSHYASI